MKTIEAAYIYWSEADSETEEVYQVERQGIIFYKYKKLDIASKQLDMERIRNIWAEFEVELKERTWDGTTNAQTSIEIKLNNTDKNSWLEEIESTFKYILNLGADLVWCGFEESSPSITAFNDGLNAEVYAAAGNQFSIIIKSDLNEELIYPDEKELNRLLELKGQS